MSDDNSIQMDEILKSLFHLSKKPLIKLVNGLFDTNYSMEANVELGNTDFTIPHLGFKYVMKRADCFFTLTDNDTRENFHLEFQLKNDKTMALRMYEYAFLKTASNAYFHSDTDKIVFPKQLVIFVEENKNIKDNLCLDIEIDGKHTKYDVPTYKAWNDDISSLLSKRMYSLFPLVPFSFRKEMDKISNDLDKLTEKTQELMNRYFEVARHLSDFYDQGEITLDDLEKMYNALNHITKHIFEKYGVIDIINKEVDKMVSTLWDPKRELKARLDGYRKLIIIYLSKKENNLNVESIETKLNNINNEQKLIDLVEISAQTKDVEDFLNYI